MVKKSKRTILPDGRVVVSYCLVCGFEMTDMDFVKFCEACMTKCDRCRKARDKHTLIGDVWICPTAIYKAGE